MTSTQTPMRVLHVTFDMRIGGTEKVILELVSKSPDHIKHEIVCLDGKIGPFGELLEEKGYRVHQLERRDGFDFALIGALRQVIQQGHYDIVHCHQYTPVVYGVLAKRFLKSRIVFTEHGRFYPEVFKPKRLLINPILFLLVSGIVSISNATADALRRFEFLRGRKIKVIYNGISDQAKEEFAEASAHIRTDLRLPENAFVFGSVLRFDPIKNIPMMIHAMAQVVPKRPRAQLIIVGGGDEFDKIKRLIDEYELNQHAHLVGYKTHPLPHVSAMDCFLLTSFSEGTAMTLLEAAMLEKPAIVTTVGGNPEIVEDNVTGTFVASDDVNALAQAMIHYIDQPAVAKSHGVAARERFLSRFESQVMADNYAALYETLR